MHTIFRIIPFVLQNAVWIPTRIALRFFAHFTVTVRTRSWLKSKKGAGMIFAANHISELDPILVPAALPFLSRRLPVFYVSRPRAFYHRVGWRQLFYGGLLFKLWGAHPAVGGVRDYATTLAAHTEILCQGGSVLIFPEGRRTRDGEMHRQAHGGVAFLARTTGCPVVPVYIHGAFNTSLVDFLLRRRRVSVTFGTPLFFHALPDSSYQQDAQRILDAIRALSTPELTREMGRV